MVIQYCGVLKSINGIHFIAVIKIILLHNVHILIINVVKGCFVNNVGLIHQIMNLSNKNPYLEALMHVT